MEQNEPPRCGHIGALVHTRITAEGSKQAARPIPCRADAAFLVDGANYRCADHLVPLLAVDDGTAREVIRLDAPICDLDAVLTAAGAQCTLDRFQEHHASDAGRIGLIAAQRDRLDEALAWLDADPKRLGIVADELAKQLTQIRQDHQRWPSYHARKADLSLDDQIAMDAPSVRQVIASLLEPAAIGLAEERKAHEAAMDEIAAMGRELDAIEERTRPRPQPVP